MFITGATECLITLVISFFEYVYDGGWAKNVSILLFPLLRRVNDKMPFLSVCLFVFARAYVERLSRALCLPVLEAKTGECF